MILLSSFSAKIILIQHHSNDVLFSHFSSKIVKITELEHKNTIFFDFTTKLIPYSLNEMNDIYNSMSLSLNPFPLQGKEFKWYSCNGKIIRHK